MSRTRWKLLIGILGLSLGGLAAVADVPSTNLQLSLVRHGEGEVKRLLHGAGERQGDATNLCLRCHVRVLTGRTALVTRQSSA